MKMRQRSPRNLSEDELGLLFGVDAGGLEKAVAGAREVADIFARNLQGYFGLFEFTDNHDDLPVAVATPRIKPSFAEAKPVIFEGTIHNMMNPKFGPDEGLKDIAIAVLRVGAGKFSLHVLDPEARTSRPMRPNEKKILLGQNVTEASIRSALKVGRQVKELPITPSDNFDPDDILGWMSGS